MDSIENEKRIIKLFKPGTKLLWHGKEVIVLECAKPVVSSGSGECKTDVWVCLNNGDTIKISVKKEDANYLENRISYERAIELFGQVFTTSVCPDMFQLLIKDDLKLIENNATWRKHTGKYLKFTLGYHANITNQKNGKKTNKSFFIPLDHETKVEILSGKKLPPNKKDCLINGRIVKDSGVAEYYLEKNVTDDTTGQEILDSLVPIEIQADVMDFYVTFKAVNAFYDKEKNLLKWDGDRPLAFYTAWTHDLKKATLRKSRILKVKANERGKVLKKLLTNP